MTAPTHDHDRLRELLADERFGALSADDRAELERLRERATDEPDLAAIFGELVAALDAIDAGDDDLPAALRERLVERGRRVVGGAPAVAVAPRSTSSGWAWLGLAATIVVAVAGAIVALRAIDARETKLESAQAELNRLQQRVVDNARILEEARGRADDLDARNIDLAQQLADATSDLDAARDRIAMYETPVDPATLAANRRRLLEVPDVVQVAWSPFDLDDENLAEQRNVTGDVVWSDSKQEGYLRFVGLAVNDPAVEQYQVWIIDERGMEQKVSGGVFNATAQGEVIVPIEPGIDVGRVQLFAVTIEEPGGIWVPSLERRVSIAPVGS